MSFPSSVLPSKPCTRPSVHTETLRTHFEEYGEIVEVRVMFDRGTRKPRGFGFVHFADAAVAEAAAADTHTIDGRTVEAKKAVPRDEHVQMRYDGGGRASTASSSSGSLHSSPGSGGMRCRKIFVGGLAPSTREGTPLPSTVITLPFSLCCVCVRAHKHIYTTQ